MTDHPPRWADALLQLVLPSKDRECVSGDLIEAYRDEVLPARGRAAADRWYLRQVSGHLWRAAWPWAAIFGGAFLARTAYDWRVPTTDFSTRAAITTAVAFTTLLAVSCWTSWRSGSIVAGIVLATLTTQIAAVFSALGVTMMIAFWHDPHTLRTIADSGGLPEAYTLPVMTIVPATILGLIGGTLGRIGDRLSRAAFPR